jgi:hypothetical protein
VLETAWHIGRAQMVSFGFLVARILMGIFCEICGLLIHRRSSGHS